MKRYGIFGGTFNPPHIAHSIAADSVREQLQLDKIIFIPSGNPPLKESISAEHRLAMAKLAFGKDKNFEISDIETKNTQVKSYTVDTLLKLNELYGDGDVRLFLIIGADKLSELPQWKQPEKLFELSEVVAMSRPDHKSGNSSTKYGKPTFVNIPLMEISSSIIREKAAAGKSIRYLVNGEVVEYIEKNNLYK